MTEFTPIMAKLSLDIAQLINDAQLTPEAAAVVEKRANVLKALADADKASHEIANIRRLAAADTRRFYFAIFAPLATVLVAACAFFFQIYQFNQTTLQKLRADQETEWRAAIDNFTRPGPQQTLKSAFLLKTFLNNGSHQNEARLFAIRIMKPLVFVDGVEMVFPDIMRHTDWSNLDEVIDWDRRQYEIYQEENGKPERVATSMPALKHPNSVLLEQQRFAASDQYRDENLLVEVGRQLTIISAGISGFLREHSRPSNQGLDINATALIDAQLEGADLHAANLTNAQIQNCDLRDADLSAITAFTDSGWTTSAWWRARTIGSELLNYLKQNYPFSSAVKYAGGTDKQSDYEAALQRLEQRH